MSPRCDIARADSSGSNGDKPDNGVAVSPISDADANCINNYLLMIDGSLA